MSKASKNTKDAKEAKHESEFDELNAPFPIKELHTKALVTLLHCYHNNRQALTYQELSLRIETGEKTKAWQCVAWKDLKSNEYIVPSLSETKGFELSDKGVELATKLASTEELAEFKVPDTNVELHNKIKAKLARDKKAQRYGPKILDLMLAPDYTPLDRHAMAAKLGSNPDSHGFFYGHKALKDMGYIVFCTKEEIAGLKESAAAQGEAEDDSGESVQVNKKRAAKKEESGESSTEPPKKKKKISGGKPWKLSATAYVHPPKAGVVPVTP